MRKLLIVAAILLSLCSPTFGQHQKATKAFTVPVGDHSGTLTWNASTSAVVGYKVYRSTTSGGPYTLLATLPSPSTLTYVDHQVQSGTTYYWVVTAYDASAESVFSNQGTGTIP